MIRLIRTFFNNESKQLEVEEVELLRFNQASILEHIGEDFVDGVNIDSVKVDQSHVEYVTVTVAHSELEECNIDMIAFTGKRDDWQG